MLWFFSSLSLCVVFSNRLRIWRRSLRTWSWRWTTRLSSRKSLPNFSRSWNPKRNSEYASDDVMRRHHCFSRHHYSIIMDARILLLCNDVIITQQSLLEQVGKDSSESSACSRRTLSAGTRSRSKEEQKFKKNLKIVKIIKTWIRYAFLTLTVWN